MSNLTEYRRQITEKFNAGQPVSAVGFYGLFPTPVLEKVRAGFERDFDAASVGSSPRSTSWLSRQLQIINTVLEDRQAERPRTAEEKHWDRIERSPKALAWLMVSITTYSPHLTYLFVMLALVFGFALLSKLLPPQKPPKNPTSESSNPIKKEVRHE